MADRYIRLKLNKKPAFLFIALALAVAFLCVFAYSVSAWFFTENNSEGQIGYGSFAAAGSVRFGEIPAAAENGLIAVNVTDPAAADYIDELRIDISYSGVGRYCLRVILVEMWVKDGSILRQPVTEYGFDTSVWFDARKKDGYFYLCGASDAGRELTVLEGGGTQVSIPLVTAGPGALPQPEGVTMQLYVRIEAVQFNRYQEVWGLKELPWEGTV